MISLGEYISDIKNQIDKSEFIYSDKFENLFKSLNNNQNIVYYAAYWSKNSKTELINILEKLRKYDRSRLLITNGDLDIPCIKDEWFDQDTMSYSVDKQTEIESRCLNDLIDLYILQRISDNCEIYCNSVISHHKNLNMIPLGRDFKGSYVCENLNFILNNKKNLCYYNCSIPPESIHWYGRIRYHIFEHFKNSNFVKVENVEKVISRILSTDTWNNYYNNISQSKFMICPRGCALDTYRMWDCIYLGCIPIVVKYDGYKQFEDLPILYVDSWKDYLLLTENVLEKKWDEMVDFKFNYDKLKFSYWKSKIENTVI